MRDTTTVAVLLQAGGDDRSPEVKLESLAVSGVRRAPCGDLPEGTPGSCVAGGRDRSGGMGVATLDASSLALDSFTIRGSETAGLLVDGEARVEACRGVIRDNGLGIALTADRDALSVDEDVYCFGNRVNFGVTEATPPRVDQTLRLLRR